MNFKKAGIFRRSSEGSEQPEVQNDSGGMLAVWGSPGSGKTVTAVKMNFSKNASGFAFPPMARSTISMPAPL